MQNSRNTLTQLPNPHLIWPSPPPPHLVSFDAGQQKYTLPVAEHSLDLNHPTPTPLQPCLMQGTEICSPSCGNTPLIGRKQCSFCKLGCVGVCACLCVWVSVWVGVCVCVAGQRREGCQSQTGSDQQRSINNLGCFFVQIHPLLGPKFPQFVVHCSCNMWWSSSHLLCEHLIRTLYLNFKEMQTAGRE